MKIFTRPALLKRLARHRDGVAFIEFALVLPFLLLVLLGGIELTRFMLIAQKVDKTSYAMGDITNQFPPATYQRTSSEISETQMRDVVFQQFSALMSPYDAASSGAVIITSLYKEGGVAKIKWQVAGGGNYSDSQTVSAISGLSPAGVNSAGAALKDRPASFSGDIATDMAGMGDGENMIVSEVFFRYQPILSGALSHLSIPLDIGERTLVRRSFTHPRNGDLICLPDTFIYHECISTSPPTTPPTIPPGTPTTPTPPGTPEDGQCGNAAMTCIRGRVENDHVGCTSDIQNAGNGQFEETAWDCVGDAGGAVDHCAIFGHACT